MNYKIITLFLFVFCISCECPYSIEDLYGTWEYVNKEEKIVLKFNRDFTCEYKYYEGTDIIIINGTFETDFNKLPIPFSIRNIPQINHPLHTIIQFRGNNEIRMAEFAPRWRLRPIAFKRETEIIFKRK